MTPGRERYDRLQDVFQLVWFMRQEIEYLNYDEFTPILRATLWVGEDKGAGPETNDTETHRFESRRDDGMILEVAWVESFDEAMDHWDQELAKGVRFV